MNKTLFDKLLDFYHLSYDDYLLLTETPDLNTFADGHSFIDIEKGKDIVSEVMKNKGKILIYGDYDADGIMGTSILVKMFLYLNYNVDYYVPNRYRDGYGITLEKARQYIDEKYDLVITVDNGISAIEAIDLLKQNKIKVLVLDHHEIGEVLPKADLILHPILSKFGNISSSGAFVAFVFSKQMLGYYDKYLSILASISLISDMMPLLNYNRRLFRAVSYAFKHNEFLNIDLLMDNDEFNETTIGMKIAPRINAIGRLVDDDSINDIIAYFVKDDKEYILNYFSYIYQMNDVRKNFSKNAIGELDIEDNPKAIVLKLDLKEGIIGLVANTLVNKYHCPVIVFTKDNEGVALKGSSRAPEGFNIVQAFKQLDKYMITAGGHALAGGCSIKLEDFDDFKKDFISLVEKTPLEIKEVPHIQLSLSDVTYENYELVNSFSPFGEGWPAPTFILKRIKVNTLFFSRDGEHILSPLGFNSRLVGFNFSKEMMKEYQYVDLIGYLKTNVYNHRTTIQFLIKEIKETK